MIKPRTCLSIVDNTGGKIGRCIMIYGGSRVKYGKVGSIILVSIRKTSNTKILKGKMYKAIIVRTKYPINRKNGVSVKFTDNAIVLLNNDLIPVGSTINGVVPIEIKHLGYTNIVQMSKEIV